MRANQGQARMRCWVLAMLLGVAGCASGVRPGQVAGSGAGYSPAQIAVTLRLARAAREAHDMPAAIQFYRELAEARPRDPEILTEFATSLADAQLYDEAIETFQRIEGRMDRPVALQGLIRAHLALGEASAALPFADRAVAIGPADAQALVNRGVVLDALLRQDEAQASYRKAMQIRPRSIAARNDLALSLALSGKYGEAIAMMAPLAQSSASTPKIRENFAIIVGLSGDQARAAGLSRIDLDEERVTGNLAFLDWARRASP